MTRILVTGAAGFLGGHLIETLVKQGHEVAGFDNLSRGNLRSIQRFLDTKQLRFSKGDVRNLAEVRHAMAGAEVVIHLAAQSNVMGAVRDPDYSFNTNVVGTYNVLKVASESGVRRLIFASSREAYGEPARIPVQEFDGLQPKNMYGASKLAGEAYCRAFNGVGSMSCTVLRFGNLYGRGDSNRVIPLWMEQASRDEDLVLYGGDQVLDFLDVSYAVRAIMAAVAYVGFGPINVACGQGTNMHELAARVLATCQSNSRLRIEPPRPVEVTRFVADVALMQRELGISPPEDPLDGLSSILDSRPQETGQRPSRSGPELAIR